MLFIYYLEKIISQFYTEYIISEIQNTKEKGKKI
jgi:hypothetical protein